MAMPMQATNLPSHPQMNSNLYGVSNVTMEAPLYVLNSDIALNPTTTNAPVPMHAPPLNAAASPQFNSIVMMPLAAPMPALPVAESVKEAAPVFNETTAPILVGSELVQAAATEAERAFAHSQTIAQQMQQAQKTQPPTPPAQDGPPKEKKQRKAYVITKPRENWTTEEHQQFLDGLKLYERDWKLIHNMIKTKSVIQIRSHAQKYFLKMTKAGRLDMIPPPRVKKPEVGEDGVKIKPPRSRSRAPKSKGARRKKSPPPSLSDNAGPIHSMPSFGSDATLDNSENTDNTAMEDCNVSSKTDADGSQATTEPQNTNSPVQQYSRAEISKTAQDSLPFLAISADDTKPFSTASPEDYWINQSKNVPQEHLQLQQSLNQELLRRAQRREDRVCEHIFDSETSSHSEEISHDFEKMYSLIADLIDPVSSCYGEDAGCMNGYASDGDSTSVCSSMATVTDNDYDSDYSPKKSRSGSIDSTTTGVSVSVAPASPWEDENEEEIDASQMDVDSIVCDNALLAQLAHADKELLNTLISNLADNLENGIEFQQKDRMRAYSKSDNREQSPLLLQEALYY